MQPLFLANDSQGAWPPEKEEAPELHGEVRRCKEEEESSPYLPDLLSSGAHQEGLQEHAQELVLLYMTGVQLR